MPEDQWPKDHNWMELRQENDERRILVKMELWVLEMRSESSQQGDGIVGVSEDFHVLGIYMREREEREMRISQ